MRRGAAVLLQLVSEEPQEADHVLALHEHGEPAQGPGATYPRQLPEDPPDLVGVAQADVCSFPPDGQELFVPPAPYSARLHTFGELLLSGQVLLGVARGLLPLPHHLDVGPGTEVALADLPANLVPTRRYGGA